MATKITIALMGILVICGGAYLFVTLKNQPRQQPVPAADQTTQQQPITEGSFVPPDIVANTEPQKNEGAGSFTDLMQQGKDLQCTIAYEQTTNKVSSEGTAYISKDRVRTDLSSKIAEMQIDTHVIVVDKTGYLWGGSSLANFAFKFDPTATSTQATSSSSFSLDTTVNYSCTDWVADESVFTPPADITFIDK